MQQRIASVKQLKLMVMKSKLFFAIALIMLFCTSMYADSQKVTYTETIPTPSGLVLRPFSLITPPEGIIEDNYLSIDLNSSAYSATIILYKDGVVVEHEVVLLDTIDGTIGYDMSLYGSGDYKMTIAFSDNPRYEAYFTIE